MVNYSSLLRCFYEEFHTLEKGTEVDQNQDLVLKTFIFTTRGRTNNSCTTSPSPGRDLGLLKLCRGKATVWTSSLWRNNKIKVMLHYFLLFGKNKNTALFLKTSTSRNSFCCIELGACPTADTLLMYSVNKMGAIYQIHNKYFRLSIHFAILYKRHCSFC